MKGYSKKILATLTLVTGFYSQMASAAWLNSQGTIVSITTYGHTETVLIKISTDGTDIAECSSKDTFAISSSYSEEARARMYAMLLAAQASGRSVTISYNDVGGCEPWGGNSSAYRKIVRLH